jgi:hypothetical protein
VPGDLLGVVDLLQCDADAGLQREVRRVGHQLVVLDQVDRGPGQLAHHPAELVLHQTHVRLDDRADQHAVRHSHELAGPRHAEGGAGVGRDEVAGQSDGLQPAGVQVDEFEQVAGDGGEEGCDVRADVLHRELDDDLGCGHPLGLAPRRQGGGAPAELADRDDLGRMALADPVGLPGNGDERPARLLAGESGSGPCDVHGLDVVGATDTAWVTHGEVLGSGAEWRGHAK